MLELLNDAGTLASITGLGLSLVQWLRSEHIASQSDKQHDADQTLKDYLEWLRRQHHDELLKQIQSNHTATLELRELFERLTKAANDDVIASLCQLELRMGDKLDRLSGKLDSYLSREPLFPSAQQDETTGAFERKYLEAVRNKCDRLPLIGLRHLRVTYQKTSIAFVSLNLEGDGEESESQPAKGVLEQNPYLTICGPAGSGKTTLLMWIAVQCADLDKADNPWRPGIPFCISLRSLVEKEKGTPRVDQFVEYTLRGQTALGIPTGWIDGVLHGKRGIVLIDGVDELPPTQRPDFWAWLRTFVEDYPNNRVCVTSRPFKDQSNSPHELWNPPVGFEECDLAELDDSAVRLLIEQWHHSIDTTSLDDEAKRDLLTQRERLPARLMEPANRRTRELCRNPLLCSLVCALNWYLAGDLPRKRVDLYRECCDLLIETRDKERNVQATEGPARFLTKDDKKLALQRLAWDMMVNSVAKAGSGQQIEVSREDAEKWLAQHTAHFDQPEARTCTGSQILNYLLDRTNLVREPSRGFIDFPHRTFQEYLAACAAGALNQHGALVNHALDDQWRETIVLAARTNEGGVSFGNQLIQGLLTKGEAAREKRHRGACFVLALACCETLGGQGDRSLSSRILEHLEEIAPPADMATADILVAAGDAVLPFMQYRTLKIRSVKRVAACARTLVMIGTKDAIQMLIDPHGYGGDDRATVAQEICKSPDVHPLELAHILYMRSQTAKRIFADAFFDSSRPIPPFALMKLTDFRAIYLDGTEVSDLQPLEKLTKLNTLYLDNTHVSNVKPLSNLINLQSLSLDHTRVSDLRPLEMLTNLHSIHLSNTLVTDLRPLEKLTKLRTLYLDCTPVSNLQPLEKLTNLNRLHLASAQVSNVESLVTLINLKLLSLIGTQISDLRPLNMLIALQTLYLNGTTVTDLRPLEKLTALNALHLGSTPVSNVEPLRNLINLKTVSLRKTQVADLRPLENLTSLQSLDLEGTPVLDLQPLEKLISLEHLDLTHTQVSSATIERLRTHLKQCVIQQ